MIKTILKNVSSEIIVKKSKFISNIFYVETEEEAQQIIKEISKKYYDAKHNCFAYVIEEKNNKKIEKQSDNGEPSGTAGAPILDVIKKNNLCNVLVVVTRYFGGILLGTGGLVRAYTDATISGIEKTELVEKKLGNVYEVEITYGDLKDFKYNCNMLKIRIVNIIYENNVKVIMETTQEEFQNFMQSYNKIINERTIKNNQWIQIET